MMKKIIYTTPDGSISVVTPVINKSEKITEIEAEQRAWDKLPKDAINPRFVDEAEIPTNRSFRNAWRDDGGKIDHDMAKAREIYKNKLREVRAKKLIDLDVQYMSADEIGDASNKQAIAAKKQILRDITTHPSIDSAKTVSDFLDVNSIFDEM